MVYFKFCLSFSQQLFIDLIFEGICIFLYTTFFRFGKWRVSNSFTEDRGPDPVFEYPEFRANVLKNIDRRIFQKPICELLHNQKFFNGIGNYLRAEILFRCSLFVLFFVLFFLFLPTMHLIKVKNFYFNVESLLRAILGPIDNITFELFTMHCGIGRGIRH